MSVSTDGIICFGIAFKEGTEFPWDGHDGDIEAWWRTANGYEPPFQLYDASGNYLPNVDLETDNFGQKHAKKEVIELYYGHMSAWEKENPLPVELVNCSSGDYPIWILCVRGIRLRAHRGFPVKFEPYDLKAPDAAGLLAFCEKFKIQHDEQPSWYLCSYWG